jgi:protoheme IX farnesyltransferase
MHMEIPAVDANWFKKAADYASLAKPKTILPHLITAAAGMFLAANGAPPAALVAATLAGGGLTAAAANTFNCVVEQDRDRRQGIALGKS